MQVNPEREIIPEVVTLSSGCKLIRYGKLRILKVEGITPTTAGTLGTLGTGDRPSTTVRNVLGTYLPFCLGIFTITTNGRIAVQYTTSYGASFDDVPNGTYVYGEVVWTVS